MSIADQRRGTIPEAIKRLSEVRFLIQHQAKAVVARKGRIMFMYRYDLFRLGSRYAACTPCTSKVVVFPETFEAGPLTTEIDCTLAHAWSACRGGRSQPFELRQKEGFRVDMSSGHDRCMKGKGCSPASLSLSLFQSVQAESSV